MRAKKIFRNLLLPVGIIGMLIVVPLMWVVEDDLTFRDAIRKSWESILF